MNGWKKYFWNLFFIPSTITMFAIITWFGLGVINYFYMGTFTDPDGFKYPWMIFLYTFCVAFLASVGFTKESKTVE